MTNETPQTPAASGAQRESAAPAGTAARHPGQPAARDEGAGPRPAPLGPRGPRSYGDRDRDRDRGGGGGGDRRGFGPPGARRPRRKVCTFCLEKVKRIDYKDVARLRRHLSDRAKIEPRRKTGSCAKHQRMLTTALKRARLMALLPYTAEHVRAMMSPQARALAGGPPPPKPERARYGPPPPRPAEAPAAPAPPAPAARLPAAPPPAAPPSAETT